MRHLVFNAHIENYYPFRKELAYSLGARDFEAAFSHAYVGRSISNAISLLSYYFLVMKI